ncbi:carbonic anhydrase 2 [Daphnia magna]|uniref:carbonic anhydrase 2 n=1 Tax=Daphnia magna TaxID=35525 RepID=UPI001E1BDA93|nr:carbonic anhydrase 2 [Daphnia magna]
MMNLWTKSSSLKVILVSFIVMFNVLVPMDAVPVSVPRSADETWRFKHSSSVFEHWIYEKSISKPSSWSKWYANPNSWADLSGSSCGGNQQSPIDIQPRSSVTKAFPKLAFHNYGNIDRMILMNNGHTAVYILPAKLPENRVPYITGGGLNGSYAFVQFHLHWGGDSTKGSEHLIKSKSYPAELHLVHYNTKYGSFADATMHSDGLAVLGIFLQVGSSDNEFLQPLVDQLGEVIADHNETTLTDLVSFKDLLPRQTSSFYRYNGSLTTPNCQQIVIWTVFDTPVEISERQLAKYRLLREFGGEHLVNNFRPSQRENDRLVFYRSPSRCEISKSLPIMSSSFAAQFLAFIGC